MVYAGRGEHDLVRLLQPLPRPAPKLPLASRRPERPHRRPDRAKTRTTPHHRHRHRPGHPGHVPIRNQRLRRSPIPRHRSPARIRDRREDDRLARPV